MSCKYILSPDKNLITCTIFDKEKVTTIKQRCDSHFPKIIKVEFQKTGDAFVKHIHKNGFEILKQKQSDGKWKIISIAHSDCIPYLYNENPLKKSRIKTQGPVITEEILKFYEKLPKALKKICAPSINSLIKQAEDALSTKPQKDLAGVLVKRNEHGDILNIMCSDIIPPLYERNPKNPLRAKSHGVCLCPETIEAYAQLSEDLKEVCKSAIRYLIEESRKALMIR